MGNMVANVCAKSNYDWLHIKKYSMSHRYTLLTVTVYVHCRFLGGNDISCVEGLSGLNKLQELYIENQRLPVGDHLQFEPESLDAIAVS